MKRYSSFLGVVGLVLTVGSALGGKKAPAVEEMSWSRQGDYFSRPGHAESPDMAPLAVSRGKAVLQR